MRCCRLQPKTERRQGHGVEIPEDRAESVITATAPKCSENNWEWGGRKTCGGRTCCHLKNIGGAAQRVAVWRTDARPAEEDPPPLGVEANLSPATVNNHPRNFTESSDEECNGLLSPLLVPDQSFGENCSMSKDVVTGVKDEHLGTFTIPAICAGRSDRFEWALARGSRAE